MDMGYWNPSSLCLDLKSLDSGRRDCQVEGENPPHDDNPNDNFENEIVQLCKEVCFTLQNESVPPSTGNQQHTYPSPFLFGNNSYSVGEGPRGVADDFDVQVIMEVMIDPTSNLSYHDLLNKFSEILARNSDHLGLDPLSISLPHHPFEYHVEFEFNEDNGSHKVNIRLAPSDIGFASV